MVRFHPSAPLRSRAEVARDPHKVEVGGSSPPSRNQQVFDLFISFLMMRAEHTSLHNKRLIKWLRSEDGYRVGLSRRRSRVRSPPESPLRTTNADPHFIYLVENRSVWLWETTLSIYAPYIETKDKSGKGLLHQACMARFSLLLIG